MTLSADIPRRARALPNMARYRGVMNGAIGMALLIFLWWLGGRAVAGNPNMYAFSSFAPGPTLTRLWAMINSGEVVDMAGPSLYRVGLGMGIAAVIGVPMGILVGRVQQVREITNHGGGCLAHSVCDRRRRATY